MMAYRDGEAIIVPRRAEGPDALGDGYERLEPGDPDYDMWDEWLTGMEAEASTASPVAAAAGGREPTADEVASGADFAAHDQAWQDALADLQRQWPGLAGPMVDDLAEQAGAAADDNDLAQLGALVVAAAIVAALVTAIRLSMTGLALKAAGHVVAEAAKQGKGIAAPDDPAADVIDQVARATAALIASGYSSAAARAALALGPAATAADVTAAVRTALTDLGVADRGWVGDQLRGALSAAQMAARQAVFAAHPPRVLLASEVLDGNECEPCANVDGTHYDTLADATAAYPLHGFIGCLGRGRCRGQLLGLW